MAVTYQQFLKRRKYRKLAEEVLPILRALKYSPDQPRDEAGRWTDGGFEPLSHNEWRDLPADPDFLYHATNMENAHEIAVSGLETHGPSYGTDQETWPDGSVQRRSYWTDKPSVAWQFAPENGKPVLLRAPRAAVKFHRESGTNDYYTNQKVGAELLTAVNATKEWVPLRAQKFLKYSADQPRDDHGRWTDGGADEPVKVDSIEDALEHLANGRGIAFERPDQAITLLHKIRKIVKHAKERGEKAPFYNLCQVYIAGANLFCSHNVDIPRHEMPQFKGEPIAGSPAASRELDSKGRYDATRDFLVDLHANGVQVEHVSINASRLRASQNQIDGGKVARILHEYEKDGIADKEFVVSSDHYIVDGHHHWAAQVALALERGDKVMMRTIRVNEKILPLLKRAKDFTLRMGIPGRGVDKGFKYSEDQPRVPSGSPDGGQFASSSGLPAGLTTNSQTISEVLSGQGNWKLVLKKSDESYAGTTYTMNVVPREPQPGYEQATTRYGDPVWYDPTVAHLQEDEWTHRMEPRLNESEYANRSLPEQGEPGVFYRGMSAGEYRAAKERGYIESQGAYNFTGQEGRTYYSTNPQQAGSYASGFAPWHMTPTGANPAFVVAVKTSATVHPHLPGEGETERALGRVPWADVTEVYQGKPYLMQAGYVELVPTRRTSGVSHTEGSRKSPSSPVLWRKIDHAKAADVIAKWDESQHPRVPAGSPEGGQFTSGGGAMGHPLDRPASSYTPHNPAGKDTQSKFKRPDGTYTPERQQLHEAIVQKFFEGKTPVERPDSFMLGGGSAVGKSTFLNSGAMRQPENAVLVNPDEIKNFIPEYVEMRMARDIANASPMVHEEASDISKLVMERAVRGKYNTVFDGTGDGTVEKLASKIQTMRDFGRRVIAHYLTVDTAVAIARAEARAKGPEARSVPISAIKELHAGVSQVFQDAVKQGLFDHVTLWDTTGRKPVRVANGRGSTLTVYHPNLYQRFIEKAEKAYAAQRRGATDYQGSDPGPAADGSDAGGGSLSGEDPGRSGGDEGAGRDDRHSGGVAGLKYSPDQPRDEQGRWTDGGATSAIPDAVAHGWIYGDHPHFGDWSELQHAARYVIEGHKPEDYMCYDCRGNDAARLAIAQQALAAIEAQPVRADPLYRGIQGKTFEVGQTFSESLSSWTDKKDLAEDFSQGHFTSAGRPREDKPTVLTIEGHNMKAVSIGQHLESSNYKAGEFLTSGEYRVTKVETRMALSSDLSAEIPTQFVTVERIGPAKKANITKYSQDQPRDDHGRWTDGGATGDLNEHPEHLQALYEKVLDGGFTVHAVTGEEPSGPGHYAVSVFKGRETVVPVEQLTLKDFAKFLHGNEALLGQAGNYFGAWVDEGKVYFDVSKIVTDAAQAETLARNHHQLAYLDFGTMTGVPVKRDKGVDHAGLSPHEESCRSCGAVRGAPQPVPQRDASGTDAGGQKRGPSFSWLAAPDRIDKADFPNHILATLKEAEAFAKQLADELRGFGEDLSADRLISAIRTGNLHLILQAINFADLEGVIKERTAAAMTASYLVGAKLAVESINRGEARMRFDAIDPQAVQWAEKNAGMMVTEMADAEKERVAAIIADSERLGRTYNETADLLRWVGLRSDQQRAADNYFNTLIREGVDVDRAETLTDRYRDKLLRQRTLVIARHELLTATHNGQLRTLREGISQGLVDPARTKRVWTVADDERLCNICRPMDGVAVDADQPWILKDSPEEGREVWIPQEAHIQCRCSWTIDHTHPARGAAREDDER